MKEYEVEQDGIKHTVLLSDEDAEAQGLKGGKSVDDVKPQPLQSVVIESDDDDSSTSSKRASASNKAQKSTNDK